MRTALMLLIILILPGCFYSSEAATTLSKVAIHAKISDWLQTQYDLPSETRIRFKSLHSYHPGMGGFNKGYKSGRDYYLACGFVSGVQFGQGRRGYRRFAALIFPPLKAIENQDGLKHPVSQAEVMAYYEGHPLFQHYQETCFGRYRR